MENYKIKNRLGKGAQGAVFLVEHRQDGKIYVLKKVECNDEGEANKAFKEAMALQELQHPFICGYREFFVTWDKEESAMYVCIVMEYYKFGDLDKVLKQKRAKKEKIEEPVLKKWLGQMVQALAFVHKKKVIHRDLKPSNIFMTEDLNISIGDFGVATVMGDARTKTRTTVGSMNWMAPEVLERPYDERSDVWSLGCIVLEMATCSFMDVTSIQSVLFEIKHSPQMLEESLEKVSKDSYSADLCQMIRTMLRRNFKQRPSLLDMTAYPYIKDALSLSGEVGVNERKKKVEAKPVPKGKGVSIVIDFIKENVENEGTIKDGIIYLTEITKEQSISMTGDAKKIITEAMKANLANVDIQIAGCNLLASLVVAAEEGDILYSYDIISIVPLIMKSHASSKDLQASAAALLMALSSDESAAEIIGKQGGVQDVLAALRAFPDNKKIASNCCGALWSLAVNEDNALIVTEEKGVHDICRALETHGSIPDVVESACAALWSLSMEDENINIMRDVGAVGLIIEALKIQIKEAKVVKNGLMALTSLVESEEHCAYLIIENEGVNGLPIIKNAYKIHCDNPEVVENICNLFAEMTEYEDVLEDIRGQNLEEILNSISSKYNATEEINGPCTSALAKLLQGIETTTSIKPVSGKKKK